MNTEIENTLATIKTKIATLLATNNNLQKQHDAQVKLNEQNNTIILNLQTNIAKKNLQLKALQLLQNNLTEAEKTALQKTIDLQLKNIDKTIALLNETL